MENVFWDKRYSGFLWHIIITAIFVMLSLFFLKRTDGTTWFLISSVLRIMFGCAVLFVAIRLFELRPLEILKNRNIKTALTASVGFLLFFLYFLIQIISGFGKLAGLSLGLFLSRVLLQQLTTGFYEELNYRFLLLEGLKYAKNNIGLNLTYAFVSSILFGLVHCVTGWDTYTFLTTASIGFVFAVIFIRSSNIVLPMLFHFIYDFIIHLTSFVEWHHNPIYDGLCACSDYAYIVMFILSFAFLVTKTRKYCKKSN